MTKTLSDIVAEAHRRISVLSVDESPSPDMVTYGEGEANALYAELNGPQNNMGLTWTLDVTPDAAYRPFAWLLAVDLAYHYERPPKETAEKAMNRFRAYAFPNDIPDSRDYDGDGEVSDAEAEQGKEAEYY